MSYWGFGDKGAFRAAGARRGDRVYAAGRALRRMEALDARRMETDENSSGALGAGENGGGSHIAVRRYLAAAAAVKLGGGLSAVGPRASWCGYGDALWKKHRAGRARVHRGTHVFVCGESITLINPPWPEPES